MVECDTVSDIYVTKCTVW